MPSVLVYSDDPAVRERIRIAAGSLPGGEELGPVEYVDADSSGSVVRAVEAGGLDALVLEGEAWPAGGLGVCRQLKAEVADCPPVLVVIAREADRWLATWSKADAVLKSPLDPATVAETLAGLLRERLSREVVPAAGRRGLRGRIRA